MVFGLLLRRLVVVGMCCLTVLGAAPRLNCLCPSLACQAACESGLGALQQDQSCCCHHEADEPTDGGPNAAGCQCDWRVSQDQIAPAVRADAPQQPLVCWLSPANDSLTSGPRWSQDDLALASGLPPDDPVSRAQILRL
jgi:hypothetical protein